MSNSSRGHSHAAFSEKGKSGERGQQLKVEVASLQRFSSDFTIQEDRAEELILSGSIPLPLSSQEAINIDLSMRPLKLM